jgi:hypothetical protein
MAAPQLQHCEQGLITKTLPPVGLQKLKHEREVKSTSVNATSNCFSSFVMERQRQIKITAAVLSEYDPLARKTRSNRTCSIFERALSHHLGQQSRRARL